MKKSLPAFLGLAAIAIGLAAPVSADDYKDVYDLHGFVAESVKIAPLDPDDFALMPWGWTPGNKKVLEDIKDCGFNIAGFMTPKYVKLCKQVGIPCIVDDPRITENLGRTDISDAELAKLVDQSVKPFKGNSAVYGYHLIDEPWVTLFPALRRWKDAIAKVDPKTLSYINLLPIGSDQNLAMYEQFADIVKPTYMSYDHYTMMDNGAMGTSFFSNLESMRKVAQKNGLPFWNIIISNSHYSYADVTAGGLSVQVYSSLAYGVKGLSYFTYFAPLLDNYRNAPIDQYLNKTPTWDIVKRLNLQIHQLAPVYTKLKSVNVFHNKNIPIGCKGIDSSKFIKEITGGDFLVGEFTSPDGTPYVMVVNKDFNHNANAHIVFKDKGDIMLTSAWTGVTKKFTDWPWFGPGQGLLISLKK